jgi:hypothetical protein
LFSCQRLEEVKVDQRDAELRRHVEQPVIVGEVFLAVFGIHHAATCVRDSGYRQADIAQHTLEVGEPLRTEIADPKPAISGVDFGEADAPHEPQVLGPFLGLGVLDRASVGILVSK